MDRRAQVTLAIPAGRGAASLETLLRSLAESMSAESSLPPPPIHVSVSQHCEWSGTLDKLEELWTSTGGTLDWHVSERGNATAMRNRSVQAIDTPWIAFLDDDVVVDASYIRELFALIENPPAPVIQGIPFLCSNSHRLLARLEAHNYQQGLQTYLRQSGRLVTLDARNLLISTDVMRDFPFDEELLFAGEGQDLAARLEEANITMAYAEDLRVYHRNRETPLELIRQKYFHGRGRAQLLRKKDDLDLRSYLRRYAVRHFASPARGIATGGLPASEGFYQLATNAVFWTGVFSEMARGGTSRPRQR